MSRNQQAADDACLRAARAAQSLMVEECGGDREPTEVEQDLLAVPPSDTRERCRNMDMANVSQSRLDDLLDEDDWLATWTRAMCRRSGIDPDDPGFQTCRRNWAKRALD